MLTQFRELTLAHLCLKHGQSADSIRYFSTGFHYAMLFKISKLFAPAIPSRCPRLAISLSFANRSTNKGTSLLLFRITNALLLYHFSLTSPLIVLEKALLVGYCNNLPSVHTMQRSASSVALCCAIPTLA